jgi:hypothetical protein
MISYFIIGALIIIPIVGLVVLARALGACRKDRDLPLFYHEGHCRLLTIKHQGDYREFLIGKPDGTTVWISKGQKPELLDLEKLVVEHPLSPEDYEYLRENWCSGNQHWS